MSNFTLYDELASSSSELKISVEDIKMAAIKGSELPLKHLELIYALILHHAKIVDKMDVDKEPYPYKIKKLSSNGGVSVNMDALPSKLQNILIHFINCITKVSS